MYCIVSCKKHIYSKQKSVKIKLNVNVNNREIACHYFSLYVKSLAQKLTENTFFVKLMYVTICDIHGHCRSPVMEPNEKLYMSSYL